MDWTEEQLDALHRHAMNDIALLETLNKTPGFTLTRIFAGWQQNMDAMNQSSREEARG